MGEKAGKIRAMREADILAIAEIEELSFAMPWSARSLEEEFSNPNAHYWIWEVDGKVGGYLGAWFVLGEAQITNVATHPEYRRLGGGKLLMEEFFRQMEIGDISNAVLEVRPSNRGAIRLYEGFGFQEIGRRAGYYQDNQEDALIFEVKRK